MTSKSDKITMRETFQIHWRAFKDVRRYCPGAFGVSILYGAAAALSPYVTVYLSARIINELAGARRPGVLWPLAVLAVASAAALTFVTGALLRWKTAKEAEFLERKNRLFADKMLSMDFADIERPRPTTCALKLPRARTGPGSASTASGTSLKRWPKGWQAFWARRYSPSASLPCRCPLLPGRSPF